LVGRLLGGLVLGLLLLLAGPAAPADAHAVLAGSSPASGSVVSTAPTQVALTFTEGVRPIQDKIHVIDPDGRRADTGEPRVSGDQLIIPLKGSGLPGTYLVNYRVLSADSHPVSGAFTYSVGAPSANGAPTETSTDVANPTIQAAFPVVRWIGYAGLVLLIGSVLVLVLLWPRRLDRRDVIRVVWIGAGLVALAAVGELLLQIPYVAGGGIFDVRAVDVRSVLGSQYGAAHLIRLGVLGASLVLLRSIVRGRGWGADRVLLAVLATIGLATWSVSGHPSASTVPMVTVVADMVHIASMSVWLGGLVMLIRYLVPRASAAELGAIVPIWSRWATYAVAALILTGVAQALIQVNDLGALFTTTYGWLLVAKVSLVAVALAVASLSRRLVAPIAGAANNAVEIGATESQADANEPDDDEPDEDEPDGNAADEDEPGQNEAVGGDAEPAAQGAPVATQRRQFRLYIIAEAAIIAVVLGLTSVLVQTTPARTVAAQTATPSVQTAVMKDKLYTLTIDVVPATVGLNEVHLYATTPDGLPADIKEWQVKASAPTLGIEPIDANILPLTADHATGQIGLPSAGDWIFSFTLRTTDIDQSTVTTTITVR
jgi:copper transport protein